MGHRGHNNNNYRRMVMIQLVTYRRFYCVAIAMNNVFTMWLWSVKYNANVYPQRYTGLTVWIFFYIIITHQRRYFSLTLVFRFILNDFAQLQLRRHFVDAAGLRLLARTSTSSQLCSPNEM